VIKKKKMKKMTRGFEMVKPSFYGQVLVFHTSAFSVHIDAFENPATFGCDKIPDETTINL